MSKLRALCAADAKADDDDEDDDDDQDEDDKGDDDDTDERAHDDAHVKDHHELLGKQRISLTNPSRKILEDDSHVPSFVPSPFNSRFFLCMWYYGVARCILRSLRLILSGVVGHR